MAVLMLGVAIDTQKPFTFTFILPGVAHEYNLGSPAHPAPGHWPVALFPFVAIVGTVLGSLLWGLLGDSIGRRAAILLAATLFIGTAMCSVMPAFQWNLVACFFMGLSAGGLLPIVYALLAETIPKRRRGEAVVIVAGIGTALGFLLASWTAHWLIPEFGWRIMWFFGVPTGLALILLNRYIPESPRFLLANGHADEAREVMRSFGVTVAERPVDDSARPAPAGARPGIASVFRRPYRAITPVLTLYGLAWGLVNFGVLVWLPTYVAKSGVSAAQVTAILAKAALFAIPGSVAVAWLYGRWNSRGTLILAAVLEAATLGVVAVAGNSIVGNPPLFTAVLVVLLISMWATISALAPYSSEVYRTAIRGAGTGVVAGATKLGGVIALAIAVAAWAPPSLAGAALLAAVPAGLAAVLLLFVGVETRGRSLEDISDAEAEPDVRPPRQRALRIGGASYPIILPSSWKDPRLLLSATFVCLHTLGQVEFHFALSIPQILAALLSCAILEAAIAFQRKRVLLWPASALLTGNGIAFILRIPGTHHGDWWSLNGIWIYVAVGVVSILSKYLLQFRGRHAFNPSNLGLVLCFVILGSSRVELVILSRVGLLAVAALFWVTFAAGMGILALSGHAFSANWHLGPVADGYFWRVLITSPEVFIFLSFMITDPQTAPATRAGRRIYAVGIGLLSVLLIAPQTTEFAAKVALLGTLTIVCAARPLILLARDAIARRNAERAVGVSRSALARRPAFRAAAAALGAASFAGLVVVAGSPARSVTGLSGASMTSAVSISIASTPGLVRIDRATGIHAAADAIDDLRLAGQALRARSTAGLSTSAGGSYLALLRTQIVKSTGRPIAVPSYQVHRVSLKLQPAVGQAPPTVVATLTGYVTQLVYAPGSATGQSGSTQAFTHVFDLSLNNGRFLIIGNGTAAARAAAPASLASKADASKGSGDFTKVHLTDVASKVGMKFRQDAFRYAWSYDPQAMMGGGVCALDFNNDGWLDLYVVNSYADVDLPTWSARGGLPRSALFENVRGRFVNVSASSRADIQVKGTGCVAADLNGDGYTDLLITTAAGAVLLWNNGDGTFSQGTHAAGINPRYDWYAGAAVADVNGDGRPDIFIAGYTNMAHPITTSVAGFPTNFEGVRDLLYLNEGNAANGRAHFKEVGVEAGIESSRFSHGLGATFTDLNGDGRPDLYVANDSDPNALYINEPGGPLGFHFVNEAAAYGVANPNAGMGVAEGDYNGDGRPDLFITNARDQPHAVYQSQVLRTGGTRYVPEMARFGAALARKATVGWGDSWVDFNNDGNPDLILANGDIPVTNLKKDTEPIQVLQNLGNARFENATGIISQKGLPKIIGRGLVAADFNNDGRVDVAINTIGGPLVLLENTGATGNWLEVSLSGFHPGAVLTAVLPDGRTLVQELHAGSSYLSSEDPRAHFGLGTATKITTLTIRYPSGEVTRLHDVAADRILVVRSPSA